MTERHPAFSEAWRHRVALLETLARTKPEKGAPGDSPAESPAVPPSAPKKRGIDEAPDQIPLQEPFSELRRREEAIARYLRLFQGRQDCFARQWADRSKGAQGYVPVRRPLEDRDVLDHLQGRRTYGIYLLQKDSRVRLGVLDADVVSKLRSTTLTPQQRGLLRREQRYLLTRLPELGREAGLPCLAEFSGGKGFHFWYFFREPVEASLVREALQALTRRIQPDLSCFQLEVFPKQDRLAGKGLGNLVKLPLGIHRLTGPPSPPPCVGTAARIQSALGRLSAFATAGHAPRLQEDPPALGLEGTYCPFPRVPHYPHPLLHWPQWAEPEVGPPKPSGWKTCRRRWTTCERPCAWWNGSWAARRWKKATIPFLPAETNERTSEARGEGFLMRLLKRLGFSGRG